MSGDPAGDRRKTLSTLREELQDSLRRVRSRNQPDHPDAAADLPDVCRSLLAGYGNATEKSMPVSRSDTCHMAASSAGSRSATDLTTGGPQVPQRGA